MSNLQRLMSYHHLRSEGRADIINSARLGAWLKVMMAAFIFRFFFLSLPTSSVALLFSTSLCCCVWLLQTSMVFTQTVWKTKVRFMRHHSCAGHSSLRSVRLGDILSLLSLIVQERPECQAWEWYSYLVFYRVNPDIIVLTGLEFTHCLRCEFAGERAEQCIYSLTYKDLCIQNGLNSKGQLAGDKSVVK